MRCHACRRPICAPNDTRIAGRYADPHGALLLTTGTTSRGVNLRRRPRGPQSIWHPISVPARAVVLLKADSQNNLPSAYRVDEFFEAFAASASSDGEARLTNAAVTYDLRGLFPQSCEQCI